MRRTGSLIVPPAFVIAHVAILLLLPLIHLGISQLAPASPWLSARFGRGGVPYDVDVFFRLASQAAAGALPYRDYLVEYPILAFPLFLLPRLVTSRVDVYAVLFAVQMLFFDLLTMRLVSAWVAAREGPSHVPKHLRWYTGFVLTLVFLASARYDLAPTAMAFAAAVSWFSGRRVVGGAVAAVGTLMKFFPACVAGPGIAQEVSQIGTTRLRGVAAFGLTLGIVGGLWWTMGPAPSIQYHLERGLQIETVWAGILMAAGRATGTVPDHGAVSLLAPGAHALAALAFPIQGVALLLVLGRFWRRGMRDPLRWSGALVLTSVLTGKVLSPQYLIWLIPFVTVFEGRTGDAARWIFLLGCLMTALLFYWGLPRLPFFDPWAVALLNLRNMVLLGLLGLWVFGERLR